MKFRFAMFFVLLIGFTSLGNAQESSPDTVVRELYRQVVAKHPFGIPHGEDRTVIWPLLSRGLIHKLEIAEACERDYSKQQKGREEVHKPEYGWLEAGIFSGGNELAAPTDAVVKNTVPRKDGSFLVYVQLEVKESFETYGRPPDPKNVGHWQIGAIVISEEGRFVIDDVLFFKENSTDIERHLSEWFSRCDGSHWIVESKRPN
jgi:hypothetical protein